MKLGYLQVYDEESWVGYQIDQMMLLCDKIIITEGSQFVSFPEIPERSSDNTLDIISDKIKEYPGRITLNKAVRKSKNYRVNQCAGFNRALSFCNAGDYLFSFDADEFYFREQVDIFNELMREGKVDSIGSYGCSFAFGFKWKFLQKGVEEWGKRYQVLKKIANMRFIPTHKPQNIGPIQYVDKKVFALCHYKWVRPTQRMYIRHKTSGFYGPKMLEWFDKNWSTLELKDGKRYNYYADYFILKKYEGDHPEILDNHQWRHVKDVRAYGK